jgi:RimJ/RimL family protein N-acetyltransferase
MEMYPIEMERLTLRLFEEGDVERIYQLVYADPEVREAWSGYRGSLDEFQERFATDPVFHAVDGFGYLAITLRADQQLIGLMGFQKYAFGEDTSFMLFENPDEKVGGDPAAIEVELTYALGRAYWGFGYATEAGRALITFGFQQLGIGRIVNAVIDHEKHRSRRLMERLGFRIVKNLNPSYMTSGPFAGSPGVIGILERTVWESNLSTEHHLF